MPRRPPHFKAFVSIQNHEKMRAVYGNNDALALWVRLGITAVERFADRTGDVFIVHDRELPALTGCGRPDVARTWLSRLADVSPICASRDGHIWRITFPNFAKKQFDRKENGAPKVPSASALLIPASALPSDKKKNTLEDSGAPALPLEFDFDPEKLVNMIPAQERAVALPWLREKLPHLIATATAQLARDGTENPSRKQLRAVLIERIHAFWAQHKKRPQANLGNVPAAIGSRAERRERAQQLYSVEQLLPEPTVEALERWEAAGSPRSPAWWLPEQERLRLVMRSA